MLHQDCYHSSAWPWQSRRCHGAAIAGLLLSGLGEAAPNLEADVLGGEDEKLKGFFLAVLLF